MDHIDGFNVINFSKCKLNNALTMPSNQDFVSTACNQLLEITHVRKQCAVSVTRDIIPCCTKIGKFKQLMTRGKEPMVLQMQEAAQLHKLTHIVHLRANPEIKFYLPPSSWKFRINLVIMFHADHCYTVLLNHTS